MALGFQLMWKLSVVPGRSIRLDASLEYIAEDEKALRRLSVCRKEAT